MLRIRLRRTGARKKPQYRLVVAESTSPRDGRYIEIIGTYNPLTNPSTINIKTERAQHWLRVGAQPSDRVHKILAGEGLMEPPKFVTTAKAADDDAAGENGAAGADEAAGAGAAGAAAESVVTASPAMAPAVEEAEASGPIPNVGEDSGATDSGATDSGATGAAAADDTPGGTVDETTADATEAAATEAAATEAAATEADATEAGAAEAKAPKAGARKSGATKADATKADAMTAKAGETPDAASEAV